MPGTFPPQGLCTCQSCCLVCFSSRYVHGSLSYFLLVSLLMRSSLAILFKSNSPYSPSFSCIALAIYFAYLFCYCFSPPECRSISFIDVPSAHRRVDIKSECSINICWLTDWMNEWMNEFICRDSRTDRKVPFSLADLSNLKNESKWLDWFRDGALLWVCSTKTGSRA